MLVCSAAITQHHRWPKVEVLVGLAPGEGCLSLGAHREPIVPHPHKTKPSHPQRPRVWGRVQYVSKGSSPCHLFTSLSLYLWGWQGHC